jgi:metal-dependent HD superfamily phosphatase/phosphodiesterase
MSNESMFKKIIENIVAEIYDDVTKRDILNIADAIFCEELEYLRELRLKIEKNKEE